MSTLPLSATVTPGGPFAIVYQDNVQGGLHSVANYAVLAAMPSYLIEEGMYCWDVADAVMYQRVNGAWVALAPPGGSQQLAFSYATSSPATLQAVSAGMKVSRAIASIMVAFNDASATLKLGTTASPSLVLGVADVTPSVVGEYGSDAVVPFTSSDFLILTISPGASTVGSGVLYYWQ